MQHFFVEPNQIHAAHIEISGGDVNHIKNVLRMKLKEELEISDGNNRKYLGKIDSISDTSVMVSIIKEMEVDSELPVKIYLYQGFPKGDKMELIVQKAVELGVCEIIPVITKRTIVKLDGKKEAKKIERYNSIALSAAKQANRGCIPQVKPVLRFREAIAEMKEKDIALIPYELAEGMDETRTVISSIEDGQSIAIFIGPEGGFEAEEVEVAKAEGITPITLGKRILRTETAGLALLSILMYSLEK